MRHDARFKRLAGVSSVASRRLPYALPGGWHSVPMKRVPTWVQFVALAFAWGSSFLFMKVGL